MSIMDAKYPMVKQTNLYVEKCNFENSLLKLINQSINVKPFNPTETECLLILKILKFLYYQQSRLKYNF